MVVGGPTSTTTSDNTETNTTSQINQGEKYRPFSSKLPPHINKSSLRPPHGNSRNSSNISNGSNGSNSSNGSNGSSSSNFRNSRNYHNRTQIDNSKGSSGWSSIRETATE